MCALRAPCSYQGGKQRVAKEIVNAILDTEFIDDETLFYDLCCGSGAITLELINHGIAPAKITMLDKSSWGVFWNCIGEGAFIIDVFADYISKVPSDKSKIKEFATNLSQLPVGDDEPYIYPILQSCSFGGKQIWRKDGAWQNAFFRDYWLPTKTSVRRSPANPMQPGPSELLRRIAAIARSCVGVTCHVSDVMLLDMDRVSDNAVIYIDPPYKGTTGYGYSFNAHELVKYIRTRTNAPVFLSEGVQLSARAVQLAFRGAKGGISGTKPAKHQEWLNMF